MSLNFGLLGLMYYTSNCIYGLENIGLGLGLIYNLEIYKKGLVHLRGKVQSMGKRGNNKARRLIPLSCLYCKPD